MLGNAWKNALSKDGKTYAGYEWVVKLFDYIGPILYAILAVVGAAGVIYSIVLGINLAKAEDQSKRDEAKKRMVTTIIAVAVTLVLIIFFNELLPLIIDAIRKGTIDETTPKPSTTGFIHF